MPSSFFVPRTPRGLIERPRIMQRMPGAEPHALTVVHAAAGMGKSSLLAQWATSRRAKSNVVWVALTDGSAGRFAFWRTVIDRLLESGLAGRDSVLANIAPASPVGHMLQESLRRALNDIDAPLTLVFDDYHVVRDTRVDDDLVWLLTHVPGLSFIVATRDVTSLTSSHTRSVIDLEVIGHDLLALSPTEVDDVVAAGGGSALAPHDLHSRTHGWPMLVRAELMDPSLGHSAPGGEGRGISVAVERIAASVIASSSQQQARFILRTSLADSVPLDLAVTLTGESEVAAQSHFAELEALALGTLTLDDSHNTWRFHPLLRAEFERLLLTDFAAEMPAMRRDLALWLNVNGQALAAAQQAVLASDWELLNTIRARHGSTLTMTHPMTYRELLEMVPDDVLLRYPGLQLSKSLLGSRIDRRLPATVRQIGGALASLAAARKARDAHMSTVGRLWNLGVVMILNRLSAKDAAAAAAADEVSRAIEELSSDDRESAASYVALAHSHIAITHLHNGDYTGAFHHAQLGLEAAESYANEWEAVHALALGSWALALQGDMRMAEQWLERARSTHRPHGWQDSYAGTGYRLAEAIFALERFDSESAELHVRALDYHAPTIEHWPFMASVESMIALTRGTVTDGAAALAAAVHDRRRRRLFTHLTSLIASSRATLNTALGDSRAAHAVDSGDSSLPLNRIAMSRIALVDGQFERALVLAQVPAGVTASPRLIAEALIIRALAAHGLGATQASAEALADAEALLQRTGLRQPLMLVPRGLLDDAIEAAGSSISLSDVPDRFGVSRSVAALTPRELVVLQQLALRGNLDAIAHELVVSRNTVKGQVSSVYRKLGVSNRAEALIVASNLGLIEVA